MPSETKYILCVDDRPEVGILIQRTLRDNIPNCVVVRHTSPMEAIESTWEYAYDLIISDEELNCKMMGHTLLKHMKTLAPKARRMMITGYGDNKNLQRLCLANGIHTVVKKPYETSAFIQVVKKQLGLEAVHY